MINIDETQLNQIAAAQGHVICEIPYLVKEQENGLELTAVSDISIGQITVRSGVVLHCHPDTDIPENKYLFDGPCHVQPGDKVWWHPNAVQSIATDPLSRYKLISCAGRFFVVIPYKTLVMKLEKGQYVGLNDYVITIPVKRQSLAFDLSDMKPEGIKHVVAGVNLPGVTYKKQKNFHDKAVFPNIGETVVLRNPSLLYLEEENGELPQRFCAVQSRNIVGVL